MYKGALRGSLLFKGLVGIMDWALEFDADLVHPISDKSKKKWPNTRPVLRWAPEVKTDGCTEQPLMVLYEDFRESVSTMAFSIEYRVW